VLHCTNLIIPPILGFGFISNQIKLATTCNKNEQQSDARNNAVL